MKKQQLSEKLELTKLLSPIEFLEENSLSILSICVDKDNAILRSNSNYARKLKKKASVELLVIEKCRIWFYIGKDTSFGRCI